LRLIQEVAKRVKEKLNIELELEQRII